MASSNPQLRAPLLGVRFDLEDQAPFSDDEEVSPAPRRSAGSLSFLHEQQLSPFLFSVAFSCLALLLIDSVVAACAALTLLASSSLFVYYSSPDRLLDASLYSGLKIQPVEDSQMVRLFGTARLRIAWLELGASLVLLFALVFRPASNDRVFFSRALGFAVVLLSAVFAISSVFNVNAEFPEKLLKPFSARISDFLTSSGRANLLLHLGTDAKMSSWLRLVVGVSWTLGASFFYDQSSEEGAVFDWHSVLNVVAAIAFLAGAILKTRDTYREGTPLDGLFVAKSRASVVSVRRTISPAVSQTPAALAAAAAVAAVAGRREVVEEVVVVEHPFGLEAGLNFEDPAMFEETKVARAGGVWLDKLRLEKAGKDVMYAGIPLTELITNGGDGSAVDPWLAVAGVMRSKEFRRFSFGGGADKYDLEVVERKSEATWICTERRGADPPLPAVSATFASHVAVVGNTDVLLVEWSIFDPTAAAPSPVAAGGRSPETARLEFVRVVRTSEGGRVLEIGLWLGRLRTWLPDALVEAEVEKAKEVVADLKEFVQMEGGGRLAMVAEELEKTIWTTKFHNKTFSPLGTGVAIRSSGSYRSLVAQYTNLRATLPEPLPVLPMHLHPFGLISKDVTVVHQERSLRELAMYSLAFSSSEFEDWKQSEVKVTRDNVKLVTMRRRLEPEKQDPFKIVVKVKNIDPLTLAKIIHSEKFHLREEAKSEIVETINEQLSVVHAVKLGGTFSREREFLFANYMREISATRVIVVQTSIASHPDVKLDPKAVFVDRFFVYTLDVDGGNDTKLSLAGLVPGNIDVKEIRRNLQGLSNFLSETSEGRKAVTETRVSIMSNIYASALTNLNQVEHNFMVARSELYQAVLRETSSLTRDLTLSGSGRIPTPPASESMHSVTTSNAPSIRKMRASLGVV